MVDISICMLTYNHEAYISEAISGILNQKFNRNIELIIGDDFSTDNTRNIIKTFQANYPKIIKPFFNKRNLGMNNNFLSIYRNCSGKYIAACEGDDFWTDPLKLQKQFDFMESNPDYVLCFHDSSVFDQDKMAISRERVVGLNVAFDLSVPDQIENNGIPSQSIFFRNSVITQFPDWYVEREVGDYGLYFLLQKHGKVRYLPFIGSVYRRHSGGVTYNHKVDAQKKLEMLKRKLTSLDIYNEYLEFEFNDDFLNKKKTMAVEIFLLAYKFRRFDDIRNLLNLKLLSFRSMQDRISKLKYFIALIRSNSWKIS